MTTHPTGPPPITRADQAPSQPAAEAYYRTLFDYAPDGILIANGERYLDVNPSMCRMLGFSRDEIIGMRASDIVAPREVNHIGPALKELSNARDHHRRWQFKRKDGSLFEAEVTVTQLSDGNLLAMVRDVNERIRAETQAANERQFSDAMLESMPGILYFYNSQGRFLRWNKNFEFVSGYTSAEISTMHPLDFFPREEKANVDSKISETFAVGDSSVEALFLSKDGELHPYFFTGRKVDFNGEECLVGMGVDITGLKQAERKLSESEQKYRELVEHANSIILRWNSVGKITFLNEFGQRYFGYTADEIVGQHVIGTIVQPEDSAGRNLQTLMQQICENPTAFEQNINQNVRRNGEQVWIAWTNKLVFDATGNIVEILSIGSDITEQREAQETIKELNENLEHRVIERTEALNVALIRAEAADKLKSAFLATMSHELRTPLNSIIGFTGILLQGLAGALNLEQSKQMGMVRNSARHLLELINDVLDLSKIEAGQLEIKAETFDPRASIERVINLVRPLADSKELSLSQAVANDVGEIASDRRRFEQILINLLNNAIKFTDRGSVSLTAEIQPDISFSGSAKAPALCIRIVDTGMGIKPDDINVLFQAFQQVDTGLARQHEGTGLGLAICRRLVELMGGVISVRSTWSKGSEFTVILPLHFTGGKS